jgi:membrane associated rhomboid family serine protease
VVLSLIAANAAVFAFELSLAPERLVGFFNLFGLVASRPSHPDWAVVFGVPLDVYWPLLTSVFVHAGFMHVIGNMWSLWIFGDNVEDRMGHARFVLFYLVCGIAAGVAQIVSAPESTAPIVGASGAIAGVMGAYFVMFPRARILMLFPVFLYPLFFVMPAMLYLAYWFLFQVLTGTAALSGPAHGGVAWWAHAGGFVAGVLLHRLFLRPRERRVRVR